MASSKKGSEGASTHLVNCTGIGLELATSAGTGAVTDYEQVAAGMDRTAAMG